MVFRWVLLGFTGRLGSDRDPSGLRRRPCRKWRATSVEKKSSEEDVLFVFFFLLHGRWIEGRRTMKRSWWWRWWWRMRWVACDWRCSEEPWLMKIGRHGRSSHPRATKAVVALPARFKVFLSLSFSFFYLPVPWGIWQKQKKILSPVHCGRIQIDRWNHRLKGHADRRIKARPMATAKKTTARGMVKLMKTRRMTKVKKYEAGHREQKK